ncbi:MAG: NFACT family protein [Clostridia bacterium]|nr:NFACT family protein [Clostridia bacterium]
MAFDGIVTKAIVSELNKNIIDARVEKINMPNKQEIVISLHSTQGKLKLLISANPSRARVHFSQYERENPIKAFQFCMVLRKYLQGNKVVSVTQNELDRIIIFTFEGLDDFGDKRKIHLIVELMGKHSNIILTNNDNKIIDSLKHVDAEMSSLREILPAREYDFPQNQERENFIGMSLQDFAMAIQNALLRPASDTFTFSQRLANEFTGFSRTFTNSLCDYLHISEDITKNNITDLYSNLNILMYNIQEGLANLIEIGNDYHFDLSLYSTNSQTTMPISDFLDNFYHEKEIAENLNNKKAELQREVSTQLTKYTKNLERVNEIITEAENAEKYKQYGELITSNIYRMKQGMKEIEVENFYDNNHPVVIRLNESYSPSRNAQHYFKKYAKLKSALNHAASQKEDYEKNIDYLETVRYQINECSQIEDLEEIKSELIAQGIVKQSISNKKKIQSTPTQFLTYEKDGIEILVGKNNTQNDKLTFKIANKTDTWLHTKDIHGSHVIIRSSEIPDEVLLYAAELASKHSQAKAQGKVSVDYTLVKNVKKIPGAKPGMVTYTNYKTIVV